MKAPHDPFLVRQLLVSAHLLYNQMGFRMTEAQKDLSVRMRNPQPGDLVVESTTLWKALYYKEQDNIGILVHVESHYPYEETDLPREQWHTVPHRQVFFIECLSDGKVRSWENCYFIALPDDPMHLFCLEHGELIEKSESDQQRMQRDIEARKQRAIEAYRRHLDRMHLFPEPYSEAQQP